MTMAVAADAYVDEHDDPREAMLDLIEANLQAGIAADLGTQLEARIMRLFPDLVRRPSREAAQAATAAWPESAGSCAKRTSYSDVERVLRLANALHFVKASRAAGADVHAETIQAEIGRLRTTEGEA